MKKINVLVLFLSICVVTTLTESCKKDESCPTINCNTGTLNEESCNCDCPAGFSGTNCEVEDLCFEVTCENGGSCVDGICDCPAGYMGTNCEILDITQVQALLDGGKTPLELVMENIPLDSLYGKVYKEGLIFYLNTNDGTGLVAAMEDQSDAAMWGCFENDITGLNNIEHCPGFGSCIQPVQEETEEGTLIGDGAMNTNAILVECTDNDIPAKLCRNLGAEWFLPSRGELNLIYINLHKRGHGNLADDWYWSSTEGEDYFRAWNQIFDPDQQFGGPGLVFATYKINPRHVRAARAF